MYACGLRVGEATTLEVTAVDRARRVLRIVGKGDKERLVPLPQPVLDDLGRVWLTHRNRRWLFPNRHGDAPLNRRTLSGSFADAAVAACLPSGATPHTLRHYVASRTMSRTVTGLCNFGRKLRIAALRDPPITRHSFVNATSCPESSAADLLGDSDLARRSAMRFWRGPVPSSQVLLPNRSVWSLPIYDRATGR